MAALWGGGCEAARATLSAHCPHTCCPPPAPGLGHRSFYLSTWKPRCRLPARQQPCLGLPCSPQAPGHSSTPHTCPPVCSHHVLHLEPSLLWAQAGVSTWGPPTPSALFAKVHTHQNPLSVGFEDGEESPQRSQCRMEGSGTRLWTGEMERHCRHYGLGFCATHKYYLHNNDTDHCVVA